MFVYFRMGPISVVWVRAQGRAQILFEDPRPGLKPGSDNIFWEEDFEEKDRILERFTISECSFSDKTKFNFPCL